MRAASKWKLDVFFILNHKESVIVNELLRASSTIVIITNLRRQADTTSIVKRDNFRFKNNLKLTATRAVRISSKMTIRRGENKTRVLQETRKISNSTNLSNQLE